MRSLVGLVVLVLVGCSAPYEGDSLLTNETANAGGSLSVEDNSNDRGHTDQPTVAPVFGGAPGVDMSSGGSENGAGGSPGDGGSVGETGGVGGSGGTVSSGGSDGTGGVVAGTGGETQEPPFNWPLPSKLLDYGTCWQDEFPNPVCKPVPELDPPIIDWMCEETIGSNMIARIVVPAGTCMTVKGRFDPTQAREATECKAFSPVSSSCRVTHNNTEEDMIVSVYSAQEGIQDFTVWWLPMDDCLSCPLGG